MNSFERALTLAAWQKTLFAKIPTRLSLLKLQADWDLTNKKIRIHRNHSFELIAAVTGPWFAMWNQTILYSFSDYDDSLSFVGVSEDESDLEVIWIDLDRYKENFKASDLAQWMMGRMQYLRTLSAAPIVFIPLSRDRNIISLIKRVTRSIAGFRVANLDSVEQKLGDLFYDERASKYSGTRLSEKASILVAREFSCHWVPAFLRNRYKVVAVDLDQTLYKGVLGEDGTEVQLTSAHKNLQKKLLDASKKGCYLALVSRNVLSDVKDLFDMRNDFPLKWHHFSSIAVNWGSKAENIRAVCSELRVGADAVIFVDDNPGELAAIAAELPEVALLHADTDANITTMGLEYYPGLWAWETTSTDSIRANDLEANKQRLTMASKTSNPMDYLRSLQVEIRIELSPKNQLVRLHELSNKTNQFNLNIKRLSEVEISSMLNASEYRVALIALKDRLSDSGIVGLVVARVVGTKLVICELTISCRALGRRLEDIMIFEAIDAIRQELSTDEIEFLHCTGPRNAPARDWLSRVYGKKLPTKGRALVSGAFKSVDKKNYKLDIINSRI